MAGVTSGQPTAAVVIGEAPSLVGAVAERVERNDERDDKDERYDERGQAPAMRQLDFRIHPTIPTTASRYRIGRVKVRPRGRP